MAYVPHHRRGAAQTNAERNENPSRVAPTGRRGPPRERPGAGWARTAADSSAAPSPCSLRCGCDDNGSHGGIYSRDQHSVTPGDRRESLLGAHHQLCAGFFHTHASSEAANDELCLDPTCCLKSRPNVVLVVRLERVARDGGERMDVYVARYTNCMAVLPRGGRQGVHAEQFMIDDAVLQRHLRAEPLELAPDGDAVKDASRGRDGKLCLTLYLTQQPCHFSSGRVENAHATARHETLIVTRAPMHRCDDT